MTDLSVHRFGDPAHPMLVLVHGVTDDGTCWPDAVQRWQDRWHVVTVDQRGHGSSPRFTEEQLASSPDVLVADLAGLLREEGRPAILVAHSLGGITSARVGSRHPELVRGLVLEDPAKPVGAHTPDPAFVSGMLDFVTTMIDNPDRELELARRDNHWPDSEYQPWADSKNRVDQRYVSEGLYLGDAAYESMLQAMTVPTLVMVPVGGEMAPDPALISNPLVRVHFVAGAGHCVRRDKPTEFHAVVDPFLESLRG